MSCFSSGDSPDLPLKLAEYFLVRSCLKYEDTASTYLLSEKQTGCLYLLKTARDPLYIKLLANEKKMLEHIHQSGNCKDADTFPVPVCLLVPDMFHGSTSVSAVSISGNTAYYVRTHITGYTLEHLCESSYRKPGIPLTQTIDYLISLTRLLCFLHDLTPPIIHRDIKPQNVIIDENGISHYIDLGISRFHQSGKLHDTDVMGTKATAPPEQFGYHQTDMRSDIYSMGILLFYCLTGEYNPERPSFYELPAELQSIIRKATMFDPDKRYQNARELLDHLLQFARTL